MQQMNAWSFWPPGIFIDTNNTVYLAHPLHYRIYVWHNMSNSPIRIIEVSSMLPFSLFIDLNGNTYMINESYNNFHLFQWAQNSSNAILLRSSLFSCKEIFIDMNDTLYCSEWLNNRVLKQTLNTNPIIVSTVAGDGSYGSELSKLAAPHGIFVDLNFYLYVAETNNNRIQRFTVGQTTGVTVFGSTVSGTITLLQPMDVVLDADGYFFIADAMNHRIVGTDHNGFRCLVGCS
jgi:sugar lactone lactonase YvrE